MDARPPIEAAPLAEAGSRFDPTLPASITAIGGGAMLALLGVAAVGDDAEEEAPSERCGLSGCITTEAPPRDPRWDRALLVGGATSAAGGLAMLLRSSLDPSEHADAGRARFAVGGMGLSLGLGLAATGLTARAEGHEGSAANGLLVTGLATSAVSAPFLAWGAATWDDDPEGSAYESKGRLMTGTILTGAGVLATGGAIAVLANAPGLECNVPCEPVLVLLATPLIGIAGAGLGVGIPMIASGAAIDDGSLVPALAAGPTSIEATWRFR